ncbi:ATP-binding protein [Nocardia sp. NPDC003693]
MTDIDRTRLRQRRTRPGGDRAAAPVPLALTVQGVPQEIASVRHQLAVWLRDMSLDPQTVDDIVLAANEAVSNAVEHGYAHSAGTIELRARRTLALVAIEVRDHGCWKTPRPAANSVRGRGLELMRALMTRVELVADHNGTVVVMHRRITSADVSVAAMTPAVSDSSMPLATRGAAAEHGTRQRWRVRAFGDAPMSRDRVEAAVRAGGLHARLGEELPAQLDTGCVPWKFLSGITGTASSTPA